VGGSEAGDQSVVVIMAAVVGIIMKDHEKGFQSPGLFIRLCPPLAVVVVVVVRGCQRPNDCGRISSSIHDH